MRVAWIGLGTMGAPMARNVLRAGHSLAVYNRTADKAMRLAALGARIAASPREAAAGAEATFVMLGSPEAFEELVEGPEGIAGGLATGSLLVDMGTDGVAAALRAEGLARSRGAAFVDAPVLGSRQPAEEGRLVVMAGGQAQDVSRARPVLECQGSVYHVGAVGAGQAMKLAANLMLGHMLSGLAGSIALAEASGVSARDLVDILETALLSPFFRAKGIAMIEERFEPAFTIDLVRKDQRLIRAAIEDAGLVFSPRAGIAELFEEASRRGWGGEDGSAVIKVLREPSR